MNKKETSTRILLSALLLLLAACENAKKETNASFDDSVVQVSTIDALLAGGFDGSISFGKARELGTFGLGTFDQLDGELVAVDGIFYQVKTDGKAYQPADTMTTPFLTVKHFKADTSFRISDLENLDQILAETDNRLPSFNLIYAVKISGVFSYLKTRSVPAQTKPYPDIADIISNQTEFEFEHIRGDMIGFRFPSYAADINASPWHFHFITEDRSQGGHLLQASVTEATVYLDFSRELDLRLPDDPFFNSVDLSSNSEQGLN